MGLMITISDGTSQTDILCGRKPRTMAWPKGTFVAAGLIDFWDDQKLVLSGSTSTQDWPFINGGGAGDCLFNTGSLFCFNGAADTGQCLNGTVELSRKATGRGRLGKRFGKRLPRFAPSSWFDRGWTHFLGNLECYVVLWAGILRTASR